MTSDSSNRNQGSEVDIAALARKYVEERTKRLRPDGIDQYRSLDEMGEEFARDPTTTQIFRFTKGLPRTIYDRPQGRGPSG